MVYVCVHVHSVTPVAKKNPTKTNKHQKNIVSLHLQLREHDWNTSIDHHWVLFIFNRKYKNVQTGLQQYLKA